MTTTAATPGIHTLDIRKELMIAAPVELTFAAILDEMGSGNRMPDGTPYPMTIEPWVGGRWFRDLGETGGHKYGHLWGHVQVIKAPTLLELIGPMPMSYPAMNFVQYRLTTEGSSTKMAFVHQAIGLLSEAHREGMPKGWEHWLGRMKQTAEKKAAATR